MSAVAATLGAILLAIGLRGRLRRIAPRCRRCRHLLRPEGDVCPECGLSRAEADAVRHFVRRPSIAAILVGLALLQADRVVAYASRLREAISPAAATQARTLRTPRIASDEELLADFERRGLEAGAALDTLLARSPSYGDETLRRLVVATVEAIERGDRDARGRAGLSLELATLLADARARGVDGDALHRIANALLGAPFPTLPGRVRAGALPPISHGGRETAGSLTRRSELLRLRVDGVDVPIERRDAGTAIVRLDFAPGRHEIDAEFSSELRLFLADGTSPAVAATDRTRRAVEVFAAHEPTWIGLATPDAAREEVADACSASVVAIDRLEDGAVALRSDLEIARVASTALAFRAILVIGAVEIPLGEEPRATRRPALVLPVDPAPGATRGVIRLVPAPELAEGRTGVETIWGESIERPVEIVRDSAPAARPARSGGAQR